MVVQMMATLLDDFFENSSISASITEVEENIIHNYYIILQVISSDHTINQEGFKEYTLEKSRQYIQISYS